MVLATSGHRDIGVSGYRVIGLSGYRVIMVSGYRGYRGFRVSGLAELVELGELEGWLDMRIYRGWRLELGVRVHQPRDMFQR